ncbi:hypothetical protein KKI24_18335 [bacterium]|nr:hypothetical protein [bacterium]
MNRSILNLIALVVGLVMLGACSSSDVVTSKDMELDDQPCWIDGGPDCDDQSNQFIYFVGRNAVPEANRARPSRLAFDSARMNAKTLYVSYLEETITTRASEALTTSGSTEDGAQSVASLKSLSTTFARKTVSGLKQHDSFYVSESENERELPLWTVYVRMRIPRAEVEQKFELLTENIRDAAQSGSKSAQQILKGIESVNKRMKQDDFFKGF